MTDPRNITFRNHDDHKEITRKQNSGKTNDTKKSKTVKNPRNF